VIRPVGLETEDLIHVGEPGFWIGEYSLFTGDAAVVSTVATNRPGRPAPLAARGGFDRSGVPFVAYPRPGAPLRGGTAGAHAAARQLIAWHHVVGVRCAFLSFSVRMGE
jgi:hypothetical protein